MMVLRLLPKRGRGGAQKKKGGEWVENEKQLEKVAQNRAEETPCRPHF